jgi:hypothetical protein
MKILFVLLHPGHTRFYLGTIKLLVERGHQVHLGFNHSQFPDRQKDINADIDLTGLSKGYQSITYDTAPIREDIWHLFAWGIRTVQDYLRYFNPIYENSPKLKGRIEEQIPTVIRSIVSNLIGNGRNYNRIKTLMKLLKFLETVIPDAKQINQFIKQVNPDVLLVSPLVDFGSYQVDYIKNAKHLGIINALCVGSWDNLTNKGLIRVEPDKVIVWNEIQKDEAINLHEIDPSRVVVTGAQVFDDWFVRKPSTTYEEFCKAVGLDYRKPFVLYLCSSPFIASKKEVNFVEEWIKSTRNSPYENLNQVGILIRPHPIITKQWENADFSRYGNVAIWPRKGAMAISDDAKTEFFDSIYHCKATIGINTSALIEAGIIGRPVYTILAPEFYDTQEGTIHFHYLVKGGLLHISKDFKEHFEQLGQALKENTEIPARLNEFIRNFIRPKGINLPCTPILANAIEELGNSTKNQPQIAPIWAYPVRLLVFPLLLCLLLARKLLSKESEHGEQKS